MSCLKTIILSGAFLITYASTAQRSDYEARVEEGIIEIITSAVIVYTPGHDRTLYGSEIHLTYWFNHTWGGGLSYSGKWYEQNILSDLALLGSWNPTKWLTVNTGLNIAMPDELVRKETHYGLYAETEYNWRLTDWFHFGLLTGTVVSNETELTAGIQMGFEF